MPTKSEVTMVLQRVGGGDRSAISELMPLVYDELRALAGSLFANQARGHTLEPTAIVNEAYLKLVHGPGSTWESRAHFFAVAARAMRQILTDYARQKKTQKRGGDLDRITLSGLPMPAKQGVDLIALEAALVKLNRLDPRPAEIPQLRFLAGLSVKETAHVLAVSTRTVEREWYVAKAWLRRELARDS